MSSSSSAHASNAEPKKWASEFSTAPRGQFDIGSGNKTTAPSGSVNTTSGSSISHNKFSTLPVGSNVSKPAVSPSDNKFSTGPSPRSNIQALQSKLGGGITGGMAPPSGKYTTLPSRSLPTHVANSSYVKHSGTSQGSLASFVGQALGVQHKGEHTGMIRARSRDNSTISEHGSKMGNENLARVMGAVVNQAQAVQQGKAAPESASVAYLAKKLQGTTVTTVEGGHVSTERSSGVGSIAAKFGGSVGSSYTPAPKVAVTLPKSATPTPKAVTPAATSASSSTPADSPAAAAVAGSPVASDSPVTVSPVAATDASEASSAAADAAPASPAAEASSPKVESSADDSAPAETENDTTEVMADAPTEVENTADEADAVMVEATSDNADEEWQVVNKSEGDAAPEDV